MQPLRTLGLLARVFFNTMAGSVDSLLGGVVLLLALLQPLGGRAPPRGRIWTFGVPISHLTFYVREVFFGISAGSDKTSYEGLTR